MNTKELLSALDCLRDCIVSMIEATSDKDIHSVLYEKKDMVESWIFRVTYNRASAFYVAQEIESGIGKAIDVYIPKMSQLNSALDEATERVWNAAFAFLEDYVSEP